jgi:hypothetical protein
MRNGEKLQPSFFILVTTKSMNKSVNYDEFGENIGELTLLIGASSRGLILRD